ncbi:MAG TPA: radical SAM protein, partial [Mycobacterium sp.]|nr:radical SAM protein [Mycobacterium sp.]
MTVIALGVPSVQRPVGAAPNDGPLIDTFGRVATDLRVSLTDRCNLRCTYCMPAEGLDWLPSDQVLKADELIRLLRIAVTRLGITSVRFTGGEPLVARHLEDGVAATAALRPRPEITLTTNGIGLDKRALNLKRAGLDRINVSLDTVDAARFAHITRRDRLPHVLAGLQAAKQAGLDPVKVNAVLDPVTGLDDAVELLRSDELIRLLRIAVTRLGINSVRFTGGEPLVARHLEDVIAATAELRPRPEITLTTNGIGLDKRAVGLKRAGLDRINVSLDTVDAARFAHITRRDRLPHVLAGL